MKHAMLAACLAVCIAMPVVAAPTKDAAKEFASGKTLLAKADFDGALQAFAAAARTDADNIEYQQHYAILRQVISMRGALDSEQDPNRWIRMAAALRAFYHDYGVYPEALRIDQKIYKQHPTADAAAMLAETQLAMNKNAEAAETLAPLKDPTPRTNVLLGIALARQGKIDDAKALAEKSTDLHNAGPRLLYELARLHALIGDTRGALDALQWSLQLTPPSLLEFVKSDARTCKDFGTLAKAADFAKVLDTESKIQESGCSGGTSCGSCPMRSNCGPKSCDKPHSAK